MNTPNRPRIEFWFDFGSNYSYLSMMRIDELALRHDVQLTFKPFLLGPIFKAQGWDTSPFVLQAKKGEYTWRDMERQSAKFGLPWNKPSTFPRRALLPLRIAVLAHAQPWLGAFCRRIMHLNFVEDREIDDPGAVAEVLASLGVDPTPWIAQARSDDGKDALRNQGEEAVKLGIFGAPTFFAGNEMFWGNDRLEDALEFARTGTAERCPPG
jgi:2-hydroxychromene-2-carboxylate isomerase